LALVSAIAAKWAGHLLATPTAVGTKVGVMNDPRTPEDSPQSVGTPPVAQESMAVWPPPPTESPGFPSTHSYLQYALPSYTSLTRLCNELMAMLYLNIVIDLIQSVLAVLPGCAAAAGDVSFGEFLLVITTAIVFLRWTYLAHKNLLAFGATNLWFTPSFAVGCFFIPVFNLVAPALAIIEIWKASNPEYLYAYPGWQKIKAPKVIVCWWLAWLCCNIMGFVAPTTLGGNRIVAYGATFLLCATSAILAVRVLREITARQEEKFRLYASNTVAPG
jgi:hypothetical protein